MNRDTAVPTDAATGSTDPERLIHPVPDDAGTKGARRMLSMVRGLSPDDLVVALDEPADLAVGRDVARPFSPGRYHASRMGGSWSPLEPER